MNLAICQECFHRQKSKGDFHVPTTADKAASLRLVIQHMSYIDRNAAAASYRPTPGVRYPLYG